MPLPPAPHTFIRRAVSPLHFESAPPVPPEDILCPGSSSSSSASDDDDDENRSGPGSNHRQEKSRKRGRRRRRVEALGTQYLQGKGLLIQSAALRGPFEGEGWMNPWGEKERGGYEEEEMGFEEPVKKRRRKGGVEELDGWRRDGGLLVRRGQGTWVPRREAGVSTWYDDVKREGSPTLDARGRGDHTAGAAGAAKKYKKTSMWQPTEERRDGYKYAAERSRYQDYSTRLKENSSRVVHAGSSHAPDGLLHQEEPRAASKRLAPYVSTVVDEASSKLASKRLNRSPKPSPYAAALLANPPDFAYRYTRKNSASASDRSGALFVDAPEEIVKKRRPSSMSSMSSSGSSAFAEALNAAQSKSNSAARTQSSTGNSKSGTDIRRLSFTASGKPMLRTSRPSSRAGPDSIDPALLNGSHGKRSKPVSSAKQSYKTSDKTTSLSKQSSKLSDKPMTNGDHYRETLPEAQVVPDALVPVGALGSSTNILETEKLPSMEDGDSYLNLSTQAAVLKAQRSFQNDIFRSLRNSVDKNKSASVAVSAKKDENGLDITPTTKSHHRKTSKGTSPPAVKYEPATEQQQPIMSTQAMIDELSPFVITTIKKRPSSPHRLKKRASFALSPTTTRKAQQQAPEPSSLPSPTSPGMPPTSYINYDRSMSTSSSSSSSSPRHRQQQQEQQQVDQQQFQLPQHQSPGKPPPSFSNQTSISILPNTTPLPGLEDLEGALSQSGQTGQDGQVLSVHLPTLPPLPTPTLPTPTTTTITGVSMARFDDGDGDDDGEGEREWPAAAELWNSWSGESKSKRRSGSGDGSGLKTNTGGKGKGESGWKGDEEREKDGGDGDNRGVNKDRGGGNMDEDDVAKAIEAAGNFLGAWDLEAEARRQGGAGGVGGGRR